MGARVNLPVIEIISQYNAEIRGLYNYYCLATDVSTKISTFQYYHYFSMIKTIARKEKSSVKKVIQKYGIDVPRKMELAPCVLLVSDTIRKKALKR